MHAVFDIITGITESKILTEHISCECKCKFDGLKCKSSQLWNNDKCLYEWKIICLESFYMYLWKWKAFINHYEWLSDYVWWNYRVIGLRNENYFNKF